MGGQRGNCWHWGASAVLQRGCGLNQVRKGARDILFVFWGTAIDNSHMPSMGCAVQGLRFVQYSQNRPGTEPAPMNDILCKCEPMHTHVCYVRCLQVFFKNMLHMIYVHACAVSLWRAGSCLRLDCSLAVCDTLTQKAHPRAKEPQRGPVHIVRSASCSWCLDFCYGYWGDELAGRHAQSSGCGHC